MKMMSYTWTPLFSSCLTYHFIYGNPSNALKAPYSIVLLKPVADKLFGSEDPIGKTITIENNYGKDNFKVTGVIDQSLGKTHIKGNMFISMNSGGIGGYTYNNTMWAGNNYAFSYVELRPDANVAALDKKLPAFLNKYGGEQMRAMGMTKELHLQPLLGHTNNRRFGSQFDPARQHFIPLYYDT